MKLSKEFLCSSLSSAIFQWNEKILLPDADTWSVGSLDNRDITVSLDSRTIQSGELFIALTGPNFDGHDFVIAACARGACGALVSSAGYDRIKKSFSQAIKDVLLIIVPDVQEAFIALAKAWRKRLTCPVVGITGSVGKTSTKEMVRSIIQKAGLDAYVSYKNYNNIFGLCYNILCVPESVKAAIFELGINEQGEMVQLADILQPTIGLITCVAHAHLAGLGDSLQTVAHEKRQLFAFFTSQDIGIVSGDQMLLSDVHYAHPVARFGVKAKNQIQSRKITLSVDDKGGLSITFVLKWYGKKASITLQGNHKGFVNNALAASAIAYFLQIPLECVVQGLEAYQGVESRFEMRHLKGNKGVLFNDCYNANPESMKAALIAFAQFKAAGPKIAVLGDMLELGKKEAYWHRQIGRVITKTSDLDRLILVGERARMIGRTVPMHMPVEFVQNWKEAQQKLEGLLTGHDAYVLVKASHGMHLDQMVKEVVEEITQ